MNTKITFRIALGLILAVTSFAFTALAQNYRGAIRGRVTDPRGALIPGAQLKLIEVGTNETRTVKTDGRGDFTITMLRPGAYRLEVEKEGFYKSSETLVVRVNQEARLGVTLTAAFAIPPFGSFGNSGRNVLDGPSYKNVNFSIVKNTAIREAATIQFRTEFFNLFNHPNFGLPDNFVGSPSFGRLVSADSPRRIQFGLKLLF